MRYRKPWLTMAEAVNFLATGEPRPQLAPKSYDFLIINPPKADVTYLAVESLRAGHASFRNKSMQSQAEELRNEYRRALQREAEGAEGRTSLEESRDRALGERPAAALRRLHADVGEGATRITGRLNDGPRQAVPPERWPDLQFLVLANCAIEIRVQPQTHDVEIHDVWSDLLVHHGDLAELRRRIAGSQDAKLRDRKPRGLDRRVLDDGAAAGQVVDRRKFLLPSRLEQRKGETRRKHEAWIEEGIRIRAAEPGLGLSAVAGRIAKKEGVNSQTIRRILTDNASRLSEK